MRKSILIIFLLITLAVKSQYYVVIDWSNSRLSSWGSGSCNASVPFCYQTIYNLNNTDNYNNPMYVFKPLTPPNFTNADIVLNPVIKQAKTADSLFTVEKNKIIATANSAVGVTLISLTQTQINSLTAVMLYQADGVDSLGRVKKFW